MQTPIPVPADAVRLTALDAGASARFETACVDQDCRALLRGLGLTDASVLRVCQQGEPCVIQVRATRIGISSRVARDLFVVPCPPDQPPSSRP